MTMDLNDIRKLVNEKDDLEHRLLVLDQATDSWSGSWPKDQATQIHKRIAEINGLLNREMGLLDEF